MTSPERPSEILFPQEQVQGAVAQIASDVADHYHGQLPPMLALLNGARPFARDLARNFDQLGLVHGIHPIHAHSYEGATSTGRLNTDTDRLRELGLEGAPELLVVDDVLDTGVTFAALERLLTEEFGVGKVEFAVVVDKVHLDRKEPIVARFVGLEADATHWLFGYGMDNGSGDEGRELPYIARFTD